MTETLYLTLWSIYGVSALLGFLLLWRLTRWKGKVKHVSGILRLLFLVFMVTPAYLSTTPDFMAPAFVVAAFDYLQGYEDGAFDATMNLGVALVVALILYSIVSLILFFVHSSKKS